MKGLEDEFEDDAKGPPPQKELAAGLADMREMAGIAPSESEAMEAQTILTKAPIDDIAARVAQLLQASDGRHGLFRRGTEIGTIDEETGVFEVMTPADFITWLPRVRGVLPIQGWMKGPMNPDTGKPTWKPIKGELTEHQAKVILKSRDVRTKLPVLEHIHKVKMPVMRKTEMDGRGEPSRGGFRKIELLQHGYDAESRTYTLRSDLDYDENMPAKDAAGFIEELLKWFPYGDNATGRSMAIVIGGMLTLYCARLFKGRSPMFFLNANLPDSGKSRLGQLMIWAVHGSAGRAGFSYEDKNEVRKALDAVAQENGPYVFFDDVARGKVRNEDLHRWLTAPDWNCRVIGTKQNFNGPLYAATVMTINQGKLNEDLERRTLIVDLFSRVKGEDRVLPTTAIMLDDDFFADDKMRSKVLAALWSLVKYWDDSGRPPLRTVQGALVKPKNSFEGWSRLVPAVAGAAGFANMLEKYDAPDGGNEEGRDIEKLMRAVIKEKLPKRPENLPETESQIVIITLQEVVGVARQNRLLQDTLWTTESVLESKDEKSGFKNNKPCPDFMDEDEWERAQAEIWMNPSMKSKFGKMFKHQAAGGRFWSTEDGDVVEVGSRESNDLAKVRLRRMPRKS